MTQRAPLPRIVTDTDVFRLTRACAAAPPDGRAAAAALRALLAGAHVVRTSQVPPDVVTMNSRVVVEDALTQRRRVVTVVYPAHADPRADRESVLSPLGAALLGRTVGSRFTSTTPSGRPASLVVVALAYQPEAAGDLHL